ncbi:unnamed protein product [Phytophthora lilii]|uniref:Unnamed protein product n=1 Tax=Phytophthora lilii TaxID=2077276 RepID=A0A9W6TN86_9STRA|nr:unnamed protein product [Phytophthora lilii]
MFLFLTNLTFSAFFFYISCITLDVHVAKPLAMVCLLISILFSGFVVTQTQLPDWLIWAYWINPTSWGLRSLAVSQYRHEQFDRCVVSEGGTNYCTQNGMNMGEYYLKFYDIQTERSWIVYGVIYNVVMNFLFMLLASRALEYKRIETPTNLVAPKKKKSTSRCTTLMDVIAGRKTGGKILLNGFHATELAIRRCSGYCEQIDIHSDSATIREALTFSAFLRQGCDVSYEKKCESVAECLELLELDSVANRCVRGCSVEQLKRLTIGVELAAQPSVLFLDEPTSGLDACAAKVIMDGVRKVANTGRTILCTNHQPSTEVFMLFDSLLLLKQGGETVFFGDVGDQCRDLIAHFETGVDHSVKIDVDFAKTFNASRLKTTMDRNLSKEGVAVPAPGQSHSLLRQQACCQQLDPIYMVTQRFFRMYWRAATNNWTRMLVYTFMGLLFGMVFVGTDYKSYQEVNSGLGMLFCTTAFLGIVSLNSAVPVASEERAAFYRERASQTYNSFWYFLGFTLAEIPYVLVSSLLFTVICLPLVGFTDAKDLAFYWLNMTLHVLCQIYLGQLLAFSMPSLETAALMGVLFNTYCSWASTRQQVLSRPATNGFSTLLRSDTRSCSSLRCSSVNAPTTPTW